MTQPKFVPVVPENEVRPSDQYPVAESWRADRPAEIDTPQQPRGRLLGNTGPDQGYGLKLARRFEGDLKLCEREHKEDAVAGCLGTALKRASLFGRAPVIYDFQIAYTLWGFIGDPPADLVSYRQPLFEAASHHYADQRDITDQVPESTLRLTPEQVSAKIGEWKSLIEMPSGL